jgi:hypothetical protein
MAEQTNTDKYRCQACGMTFKTKEQLEEHNRTMHARPKEGEKVDTTSSSKSS